MPFSISRLVAHLASLFYGPGSPLTQPQKSVLRMRFLGYVGAQFDALLVPVLVFQISSNMALAGLALMVEWAPKTLFFAAGGSLSAWAGPARAHLGLDMARLLALLALVLCAFGLGNIWAVAVAAAVFQGANAISNILFERAVSTNWDAAARPAGHARNMRQDQLGCFMALLIALAVNDAIFVAALASVIQIASVLETARNSKSVHGAQDSGTLPFKGQMSLDIRTARSPRLFKFGLAFAAMAVPGAAATSFFVFMLGESTGSPVVSVAAFASLLFLRVSIGLLAMQWMLPLLSRSGNELILARIGFVLSLSFSVVLAMSMSSVLLVVAATGMAVTRVATIPFLRAARQSLIAFEVPIHSSRPGVTGLLSIGEAFAYLVAGALAWFSQGNMALLLGASALIGAAGAWYLVGPSYRTNVGALTEH